MYTSGTAAPRVTVSDDGSITIVRNR